MKEAKTNNTSRAITTKLGQDESDLSINGTK